MLQKKKSPLFYFFCAPRRHSLNKLPFVSSESALDRERSLARSTKSELAGTVWEGKESEGGQKKKPLGSAKKKKTTPQSKPARETIHAPPLSTSKA